MTDTDRRCGTCRLWYHPPEWSKQLHGYCKWTPERPLPESCGGPHGMGHNQGTACECWEKRHDDQAESEG